jgi:hypothetical protein
MKQFKKIDMWISIVLIIAAMIWVKNFDEITTSYFIIGGWQIISMVIHIIKKWFTHKGTKRQTYQIIVLVTITFTILSIPANFVIIPMYILLFAAPLMAIYYTVLCFQETYIKMKRPLEQLK